MKKFFSILLTIIFIFNFSVNSYAVSIPDHDFNHDSLNSYWELLQDVGFIVTWPAFESGRTLAGLVKSFLNSKNQGSGDSINSDTDAGNWARNNITVNGNGNVVLNDEGKLLLNYMIDDYKNDNRMYKGYSVDLQYYSNIWNFQTTVEQYQDDYYCFAGFGGNPISAGLLVCIPHGVYSFVYNSANGTEKYKLDIYDTLTFNSPSMAGIKVFDLKSTGPEEISVNWSQISSRNFYCANRNYDYRANEYPIYYQSYQNDLNMVSYGKKYALDIFGSYGLFTSTAHGSAPYYINNSVYSDFSSSTGDFTITTDNSNHATYGDIEAYIGNTYNETGKYPTPEDININIEIISDNNKPSSPDPTPTPNPSNPSGGASANANNEGINININNNHNINFGIPSLSGNSVSGNGSGSSGGFFDWISDIGSVIGDFIKNVGQLLAEAIRGIAEAIEAVLSTIPNVLSSIVEFVYGGLPDELKALVTLGITAVVFVSVIKILRK